jgi:CRP/FNR family cyclic AMP-dependent transcriptional regulator
MTNTPDSYETTAPIPPDPEARASRSFQPGEMIFREGDPSSFAYLLDEGTVRLIKKVRGAERSFVVLKPGEVFGEAALVAPTPRSSTAVAVTASVVRAFSRETLEGLITRDPAAAAGILRQIVRRLADAEDQIEIMMLGDTQSKVVSALLKVAQQARTDGPGATFILSPMELSARIGLDVDTVKRTVQQLREGQYLRVADGRLEVPDIDAMRRLYALLGVKDEIRGET